MDAKMERLFKAVYNGQKTRKVKNHDKIIDALRGQYSDAAVDFLDQYRGESELPISLLCGTIKRPLARRWGCMAFTVPPFLEQNWESWGIGEIFSLWTQFSASRNIVESEEYLSFESDELASEWFEFQSSNSPSKIQSALQIGSLAGGDGIWALEDGSVWFQSAEFDELPFLKLFDDLNAAVQNVEKALESGELKYADYEWTWGELTFAEGDEWI